MLGMWAIKHRRLPKGRRAKSGHWWRRYPRAVLWGSDVGRCVDAVIGEAVRRERETRMALEDAPRAKTLEELKAQVAVYGTGSIHIDDAIADYTRTNA